MLPREAFLFPTQNIGFEIPKYIATEEALERCRPPRVVRTLDERLSELSETQLQALDELRSLVKAKEGDLFHFVDDWTLVRYLVARSFRVTKAYNMLEHTAHWRQKHPPEYWKCKLCHHGNAGIHMLQFCGWDLYHRPVLYASMRWSKERNDPVTSLIHTVEAFNHAVQMMPMGVEQWVFVTDFHTYSHLVDGNPRMSMGILQALQDHFPERLGLQVMVGAPTVFGILFKMLSPFIDARTKAKIRFVYNNVEPSIQEVFPTLFPKDVSDYLCRNLELNCDAKKCQAVRDQAIGAPTVTIKKQSTSAQN